MASVDFLACAQCRTPVPANQTVRCASGPDAVKCTTCAHSGDAVPTVDHFELSTQLAALPWTPPFIECIGIVQFDLQVGQVVEYLYPPLPFSVQQETELAFLCFPDANHLGDGGTLHDFMYAYNESEFDRQRTLPRRTGPGSRRGSAAAALNAAPASAGVNQWQANDSRRGSSASPQQASGEASGVDATSEGTLSPAQLDSNASSPTQRLPLPGSAGRSSPSRAGSPASPASPASSGRRAAYDATVQERFCSTLFRQRKDATIFRGHQQKAIFIMSAYPFPALFHRALRLLCHGLFDTDTEIPPEQLLEMAWRDISMWPRPLPCRDFSSLPLLGEVLAYSTPEYDPADIVQPIWSVPAPSTELTVHEPSALQRLRTAIERRTVNHDELSDLIVGFEMMCPQQIPAANAWLLKNNWDPSERRFVALPIVESPLQGPADASGSGNRAAVGSESEAHPSRDELDDFMRVLRSPEAYAATAPFARISADEELPDAIRSRPPSDRLLSLFRHSSEFTHAICETQNAALRRSLVAAQLALDQMQLGDTDSVVAPDKVRQLLSELEVHAALFPHVTKAWKLWELMIVGEPIAFLGPSAPAVSAMALSVAALIAPLPWVGLLRPYVTINNREIDHGIDRRPLGATIVGATNPFFVRHLEAWPHMVCVSQDMRESTSHKTWPATSDKRQKQQFKLKNRMFCSRHYLVRTDKEWGSGTTHAKPPDANKTTFVDEGCGTASASANVLTTFAALTQEFVAPLEQFVALVMRKHQPYFVRDAELRRLLSHRAALEYITGLSPPPKSFARFKNAKDAADVYEAFLLSPLGQRWLQLMVRQHYRRFLVEDVSSLEDAVRLCPVVADRHDVLAALQGDLDRALGAAVLDVPAVKKLVQLCAELGPLREALAGVSVP